MSGEHQPAPGRILVVDDAESNRYVLATWLRRAGHDVVEATTGIDALKAVALGSVDLVVLDINLPDMTGYEVCERIKQHRSSAAIPVLHVSATATAPTDRSEGLRRGADGYLVEPVEREELLASVEALLRGATAQRTAIRLARRLRALNDATLALNEVPALDRLVETIVREACALFETTAIVAAVVNDAGIISGATPDAGARVEECGAAAVDDLRRAIKDRKTVPASLVAPIAPVVVFGPLLVAEIGCPDDDRGIILVELPESTEPSLLEETDLVLKQYARAASTAIRNVRSFDIERQIALTLQQNLLPDMVPPLPGLDVAVRYKASAEQAEVGGDFYEIFAFDERRVAIAIGDVAGHSLEAAAVMAQLRMAIRSYMLEGHQPDATLTRLNNLLLRFHPDVTATVCCAIFDRSTGHCELANAGHPPALIATRRGVTYLPVGGALLGVDGGEARSHHFDLKRGDVFLLYTDGLVERRNETIDDGLQRLALAAADTEGSLDDICDRILREAGPANPADDIALVAIRPTR